MNLERSMQLYNTAKDVIPGGVNSPARSWGAVGGNPLFLTRGSGSRVWDADGNEYIDYVCSWGPLILGHANEQVIAAITQAAADGTSFGAPTERENEIAQLVVDAYESIEMVRFVNSGTEATMSALRSGAGVHRQAEDRKVRGRLPRPFGRAAGCGGIRRAGAWRSGQRRRNCVFRAGHAAWSVQRLGIGQSAL